MVVIHLASSPLSHHARYSIARVYGRQEATLLTIIPQAISNVSLIAKHPHITIIQVSTIGDMVWIFQFVLLLVWLS